MGVEDGPIQKLFLSTNISDPARERANFDQKRCCLKEPHGNPQSSFHVLRIDHNSIWYNYEVDQYHRIGVRPSRAMPFNRPKTCDPIQSTLLAVFSRRTSESRLSETGSSFEESCGTSPWHVIVCSLNCGRTIAGRTWAAHLDGGCFRSGSRQMRVQY